MTASVCRGCGEPVVWVLTTGGKKMPANAGIFQVVVEKGGPLRVILDDGSVVAARPAAGLGDLGAVVSARTSHFAVCSHANRFRTAKGRTAP